MLPAAPPTKAPFGPRTEPSFAPSFPPAKAPAVTPPPVLVAAPFTAVVYPVQDLFTSHIFTLRLKTSTNHTKTLSYATKSFKTSLPYFFLAASCICCTTLSATAVEDAGGFGSCVFGCDLTRISTGLLTTLCPALS